MKNKQSSGLRTLFKGSTFRFSLAFLSKITDNTLIMPKIKIRLYPGPVHFNFTIYDCSVAKYDMKYLKF